MFAFYCDRVGAFVLDVGIRGLILMLAAGAVTLMMGRSSASLRSFVWRLALFGLVALPWIVAGSPPLNLSITLPSRFQAFAFARLPLARGTGIVPEPQKATTRLEPMTSETKRALSENATGLAPHPNILRAGMLRPRNAPHFAEPQHDTRGSSRVMKRFPAFPWRLLSGLLATLWAVGVLGLLSRFAAALGALCGASRKTKAAPDPILEAARIAARDMRVHRVVSVRIASSPAHNMSPMTWGAFHPVLLLPAGSESWPADRLRTVLLHELAHISRGDWAAKVLADLVSALYWPNPCVWFAARQMRKENELACDDRVLGCGVGASDYAAHLLEVVRMRKSSVLFGGSAIAMADPTLLETRVRAALDPIRPRGITPPPMRVAIAALLVGLLLPLGAMRLNAVPGSHTAATTISTTPAAKSAVPSAEDLTQVTSLPIRRLLVSNNAARSLPRAPIADTHRIAWGTVVHGLQAGLERADAHKAIVLGQHASFRLWIRNTGAASRAVHFPATGWSSPFFWNILVANGSNILITPQASGGAVQKTGVMTLGPGQARLLPMPAPVFKVETAGNSTVLEATAFVTPGRKQVQVSPFAGLRTEDEWMGNLATGKITLDVGPTIGDNSAVAPHRPVSVEPASRDTLRDVAWGAPVDGLVAGIRIPGAKRRFAAGERVPMECYLRNATDHDISFSYTAQIYSDQLPIVRTLADPGKELKLRGVHLTGLDAALLLTLGPHETLIYTHPGFVLGDKPRPLNEPNEVPKGLEQYPYLEEPVAGKYTVEQPFVYHISTPEEVRRLADRSHAADRIIIEPITVTLVRPDGTRATVEATTIPFFDERSPLQTGRASFSIAGGPEGTAAERTIDSAGIAWGPASEGLQAGLRAPNHRTKFLLGSTVAMEYVIRNVSHTEIGFDHDVFPGVAGIIPDVVTLDGKPAYTFGFPTGATSAVKHETLKPGEMVVIGQTAMGIAGDGVRWFESRAGHVTIRNTGENPYTYVNAKPGSYRIRHLYTVYSPQFTKRVLYTGYLPLDIVASAPSGRPETDK